MGNFMDTLDRRFIRSSLASVLMVAGLAGCTSPEQATFPLAGAFKQASSPSGDGVDLVRVSYSITDALIAELRHGHPAFDQDLPVLVASFVNRSNLDATSELGLLISDHVASRMTQQGYTIIEPKLRQDLSIRKREGEFILSRDVDRIFQENGAYAVVVGSYTEAVNIVDFTAKIVEIKDRKVLASVDAKLPIEHSFRDLLMGTDRGTQLEVVAR